MNNQDTAGPTSEAQVAEKNKRHNEFDPAKIIKVGTNSDWDVTLQIGITIEQAKRFALHLYTPHSLFLSLRKPTGEVEILLDTRTPLPQPAPQGEDWEQDFQDTFFFDTCFTNMAAVEKVKAFMRKHLKPAPVAKEESTAGNRRPFSEVEAENAELKEEVEKMGKQTEMFKADIALMEQEIKELRQELGLA